MSRKEKLETRANQYGKGAVAFGPEWAHFATGFEDGYRAAMRDMRKLIADCYKDAAPIKDPMARIKHRNHCARVRVERFLRPLR